MNLRDEMCRCYVSALKARWENSNGHVGDCLMELIHKLYDMLLCFGVSEEEVEYMEKNRKVLTNRKCDAILREPMRRKRQTK